MDPRETPRWIFVFQVLSVTMIWVFVLGISGWIIHLLRLSHRLHDVPSASVGISIVAIPVFLVAIIAVITAWFLEVGRREAVRAEARVAAALRSARALALSQASEMIGADDPMLSCTRPSAGPASGRSSPTTPIA